MLVAAAISAPVVLTPSAAQAVANDVDQYCWHTWDAITFNFGGTWPSTQRAAVKAGIQDWNSVYDYDGSKLLVATEVSGSSDIAVTYENLSDGLYGTTLCGAYIRMNSDYGSDTTLLRTVARHEFGHEIGLDHVGSGDSFDQKIPTMATCLSTTVARTRVLSQDDRGYLLLAHTTLSPRGMMANPGFETTSAYYGLTSGSSVAVETSGGATGPGHVRFNAGSTSGYIYQTMNYVDAPSKPIVAAVNDKRTLSTDGGTMRVELWARQRDYASGANTNCDYPNGKDMETSTLTGAWARRVYSSNYTPSTGWVKHTTPQWTTFSNGSQDVQVRIFENASGSGNVRLDNVRISCVSNKSEGDCQ